MTKKLRLTLFGGVEVIENGEPVTGFVSTKAQALLCYLAVTQRPQLRPALSALLWGDMAEADARVNLRMALSNLRRLVGSHLVITRQTVAFNQESLVELDVETFSQKASPAMATAGHALTPAELTALSEAADLYQGDFLAGFQVRDAPAFEEWVLGQQERLRELALQSLHTLAAYYTAHRAYASAITYTARLLALDPWREEAHRHMMLLLARSGRRSAALTQYETCRCILAEAFDVEPMAETTALYRRLRSAEARPPHNLPPQPTPFIGRSDELADVMALLGDPTCRLLTITGPGGIGKTRLALEAAATAADDFINGVRFVPLAAVTSLEFLVPAIADAVDVAFYGDSDVKERLLDTLSDKELLLVLDNFEQLLSSYQQQSSQELDLLAEILNRVPAVKLLLTSRERLSMQGEWVFELVGLDFPSGGPANGSDSAATELAHYDAVQLFRQSAHRTRTGFELTPANAPAVIDICRLVGGMPLGLELAASWIRTLSCAEIAAEIAQSLDFLSTSRHDVPARHQSLNVVFAQSWQLLSEPERHVFRRLSIFRGGFSREAAAQVAGASLPILSALVDKSLLRRNRSGHYEPHELVRQYAAEKLDAIPSERLETQARHGRYYAAFLQRRDSHLKGRKQPDALAEIKGQIENIRSAWQWAIRQGQLDAIEQSQECLYFYYEICGRFQEGEELFQQAIAGLTECHPAVEKVANGNQAAPGMASTYTTRQRDKLLAELLARRGGLLDRLGLYEQAQDLLQQSLAMFEQLGAYQERAFPLYHLAYIAFVLGEYEAAKNFAQESLALFRAGDDRWGIAPVLNTLGDILIALGIVEEAQYVFQESLEIATDLELRAGVGWSHQGLGDTNRLLKDYAVSQAHYEQGLAIFKEVDAREGMAWALHGLGDVARERQDYRQAAQYQQQSLDLFEEIGDLNAMSETLNALGNTAYALADYDQARVYFQRALQVAVEVRAIPVALDVLVGLARVLAEAGACEQALELLAVSLDHPGSEKETLDKAASFLSKLPAPLAPAGMRAAQAHHAAPTLEEVALKLCENLTGF